MPKILGVGHVLQKRYKIIEGLPDRVTNALGILPDPFHIVVTGKRKNGKTSFVMQMVKELGKAGLKVFYNSLEEGDSKTIQDAFIRSNMVEAKGKVMLGDGFYFDDLMELLRNSNYKVVVIDSLDYMKLTKRNYIKMVETFPRKSFIILTWGQKKGNVFTSDDYYGRQIEYMVGAVVGVDDFTATAIGRYGPTEPYDIWPNKPKKHRNSQLSII